ncbi:protein mono-ADP-ribosyltransferase PARP12-like isoform X2 [Myxocyprinus asiaticus]|uniref:protein mono-ADP-ribosyltransferase PARP12-like isoform X2 n=1 Tax=Myxocyprinus asiaticus TaxID=70543 RepID=UPI0022232AA0|nr:protein mono-ADP-ribosyltransferase PARP12-like isoform X2 [Myxocyprinus asiaticus]
MASIVSNSIYHFLCKNEGCSDFGKVESNLRQSFTVADQVLSLVLDDQERFVVKEDEDSNDTKSLLPADSLIIAKTSLRVCKNDKCVSCEDLHLCRYFVCGNCRFGTKCKNSHDLASAHNSDLLRKRDLQGLTGGQLFRLLLQNDPFLLPEVCSHYNKGNGEHGSCKYKTSCTNLHLCQHFLQDDCKFGAACKRAHRFDAQAQKILNGRGISPENMHKLHKIYKNKFLITSHVKPVKKRAQTALPAVRERTRQKSSSSVSEADHSEICLFFLRTGCSFKDKCVRVHHHLPYKWQISHSYENTWTDLPNEEEIEKAFCSPSNDLSITMINREYLEMNFITMTCEQSKIRRLSTASSVTKPPHFILTTEWLWYWKNDSGGWTEYGKGEDAKLVASVTSEDLEKHYLADSEKEITFNSENHKYTLKFKDMYQQNQKYKTVREIRRRPRFVSAQEIKSKIKRSESPESSASSVEVPSYWDKGALPSFTYKIVPLQNSSKEYKMMCSMFSRTMPSSIIHRIERVQNQSLWRVFQWQKEQMIEKNGGKVVDQRYLFHGTDESLIEAICEQNFDWRICGSHGTLYGKGSYFARDASYSDRYAKSRTKTKKMFVALVLVGEFTKGNSSLVRPPQKKSSLNLYDSCVDNETNPAIFVVFEKYQIYPEYIIEYS